jgi:hypothetical protein
MYVQYNIFAYNRNIKIIPQTLYKSAGTTFSVPTTFALKDSERHLPVIASMTLTFTSLHVRVVLLHSEGFK